MHNSFYHEIKDLSPLFFCFTYFLLRSRTLTTETVEIRVPGTTNLNTNEQFINGLFPPCILPTSHTLGRKGGKHYAPSPHSQLCACAALPAAASLRRRAALPRSPYDGKPEGPAGSPHAHRSSGLHMAHAHCERPGPVHCGKEAALAPGGGWR